MLGNGVPLRDEVDCCGVFELMEEEYRVLSALLEGGLDEFKDIL